MREADGELAAYGIRLSGLGAAPDGTPPAPTTWPRWAFLHRVGAGDDSAGTSVYEDSARLGVPGVGEYRLDRRAQSIDFTARAAWSADALLHPALSPAAAVVAHWMGRATLHAAAVVADGRAWGLLGDRGAGKSTAAAQLVDAGCDLLTDDLLVLEGDTAFAGPGAVDLRADVGARLGGEALGRLGGRERWRRRVPRPVLSAPLAGWVLLRRAGGPPRLVELAAADRVGVLGGCAALPPAPESLLALADRPMQVLLRSGEPGDWEPALRLLLRTIAV